MGRWGERGAYHLASARHGRGALCPTCRCAQRSSSVFPGEDERHFERLLSFVEEAEFDHAGGFGYSPEEGTIAAGLKPRVRKTVAETG